MSYFYGTISGQGKTRVTCTGSKKSGLMTQCASWAGAIQCEAYINNLGMDCVRVKQIPWEGRGISKLLYNGPMGEEPS